LRINENEMPIRKIRADLIKSQTDLIGAKSPFSNNDIQLGHHGEVKVIPEL
jgi:hypothetical protein